MKELVNQWFEQTAPFQGILACGLRHPDQSAISKTWTDGFPELAVDNAIRCATDLYQVMALNRIAPGRVRWVYQGAVLCCERRADGTCLGVFISRDERLLDSAGVERIFGEFQSLAKPSAA